MEEQILSTELTQEDIEYDKTLRPRWIKEFIGQTKIKENLSVFIEATKTRNEALDHVLLSGPAGLGKTTLAGIIANELGVNIKVTSGPALERAGDLAAILTNLEPHDVFFIDEIHRLSRNIEEVLYPAMEDYKIDIIIGKGPGARSLRLGIPHFTLIGATTRTGLITSPLRDRFGVQIRLEYYNEDELYQIVRRSASILGIEIDVLGAKGIAACSRGTPRVANRLLKRVRDYAEVKCEGIITAETAVTALSFLEVDDKGLDKIDKKILLTLIEKFGGSPVGLNTLAMAVGEEPDTIEEVYEPYLLQLGFIQRTPRGRVPTESAYKHLKIERPHKDRLF